MTVTLKREIFSGAVAILLITLTEVCCGSDPPKSYGPVTSPSTGNNYQNNYDTAEFQRPLAVFTEKPVNVADFVLIPVVQVPSSDLRMIYRPQIDSVSKTEPIVMCRSSAKSSFEATPAVQVPLQQPFYLYDERTVIPFPKAVTILHGGYRMSIPVGVVVAPVPAGVYRDGPIFVTTLYAIPAAGPVAPVPARYVPWSSPYHVNPSAPQYSAGSSPPHYTGPAVSAPPSSPLYSQSAPPSSPSYSQSAPPSPPSYSQPAPPSSPLYSQSAPPSSPLYSQSAPPSPPLYSQSAPPSPPFYAQTAPLYSNSYPAPSTAIYSQPAPPSPTYYQHSSNYDGEDTNNLRIRDPPGKLYSQSAATSTFQNSKESPILNQLREEADKNRKKYGSHPPYYNHYQTVDA